jgi:osmotically inducible protein OsmC
MKRNDAMAIHKKGQAHWAGDLKHGKGTVSTESGVLKQQPYGFNTRFEGAAGTNPEELIAAAHAACFSMALSLILGEVGYTADSIDTTATVTLDQVDGGFAITKIALKSAVKVPGADAVKFDEAIQKAKAGCPVSKVLNAEISLEYTLN